ncbi:hypothetical protein Tco_0092160 [Tanacetum coccineum]
MMSKPRFTTYTKMFTDLLTKTFDVGRFQYLIASIGMLNLLTNDEIQVSVVGLTYYWRELTTVGLLLCRVTAKAKTVNVEVKIQALVDGKKVIVTETSVRRAVQLKYAEDETENVERVPTYCNDPLLSGEDRLKLNELIELCTKLSERVLDLKNTKTSQAAEITKLKERVKKLERRNKSRTLGLKRLRKGRKIADLDADVEYAEVTTVSATTTVDELTLAQTLIKIKAAKPKAVITDATTTTTTVTRPKARGVVVQELTQLNAELKEEEKLAKIERKKAIIARLRAKEQRRKPTNQSSKRNQMRKEKDEGSVTRAEESSSKRASTELEQERIKKQKIDDDQEEAEMKKHMEIVDEEEIAVDAIPLATSLQ